jgi:predicted PurR-regulated permease PerM
MTRAQAAASVILLIVVVITVPLTVGSIVGVNQIVQTGGRFRENYSLVQDYLQNPDDKALEKRIDALGPAWRYAAHALKGAETAPRPQPGTPAGTAPPGDGQSPSAAAPEQAAPPPPQEQQAPAPDAPRALSAAPPEDGLPNSDSAPEAGGGRATGVGGLLKGFFDRNIEGISRFAARNFVGTGANAVELAARLLKGVFVTGFSLFLVLFFFFFFCTGYGKVTASLQNLIPQWRKTRTLDLLRQMDEVIAGFVRGRLIIMAILMVAFTLGYLLIGVPGSFIVGPIVGILAIVPYLGLVSIPTSMVLMWLQPVGPHWQQTWWWIVLAPIGLYFFIQTIDDYVLTPIIQGKTTQMDTPTILFSVLAGGILLGFYGVLIAIPLGACIKILLRESFWPRFRAWAEGRVKDFLPISRYDPAEASLHSPGTEKRPGG